MRLLATALIVALATPAFSLSAIDYAGPKPRPDYIGAKDGPKPRPLSLGKKGSRYARPIPNIDRYGYDASTGAQYQRAP